MTNLQKKYRLVLWILLLVIVFFIGIGRISLNKGGDFTTSFEQPIFRFACSSFDWLRFSIGGKMRNLVYPLLILWGIGCIWDRKLRPNLTAMTIPIILFLSVAFLSYILSPLRELSWRFGTRELLLGGGFYFAAAALLSSERYRESALRIIFISMGLSALAGIYLFCRQIYFPDTPYRIWLSFMHPNTAGSALLILIPIGVAMVMDTNSRWFRVVVGVSTTIMIIAMILTFSRTAWISLLVAMFVLAFYWRRRYYFMGGLLVLAALLVLGVNIGPQTYLKERIESFSDIKSDRNIKKRLVYWDGVSRMIRQRPLLGYGPGNRVFMEEYETRFKEVETGEEPVHTHNMYLSLGVATGLVGLGVFLWLLVASFYKLKSGKREGQPAFSRSFIHGMTAGLAGFLIGGLADNPFFSFRLTLLFWFLLALIYVPPKSDPAQEAYRGKM